MYREFLNPTPYNTYIKEEFQMKFKLTTNTLHQTVGYNKRRTAIKLQRMEQMTDKEFIDNYGHLIPVQYVQVPYRAELSELSQAILNRNN